eukprot:scaffold45106_cov29-Prasinocladus_malaysianus.AAC.1
MATAVRFGITCVSIRYFDLFANDHAAPKYSRSQRLSTVSPVLCQSITSQPYLSISDTARLTLTDYVMLMATIN